MHTEGIRTEERTTKSKAFWITHKASYAASHQGLYHFKRHFIVEALPDELFIRLCADQEYKLYLNGRPAGHGPVRSDIKHSYYDRRNLRPFLRKGRNSLHLEVLYLREAAAASIQSANLACFVEFENPAFKDFNSNAYWQVSRDPGTEFLANDSSFFPHVIPAGPREMVRTSEKLDPLDVARESDNLYWIAASPLKEIRYHGSARIPGIWDLHERPVDYSIEEKRADLELLQGMPDHPERQKHTFPVSIPAHSNASFLFRYPSVCTAFIEFSFQGGKGSSVRIIYNESMYEPAKKGEAPLKAERDAYEGKELYGLYDALRLDGGPVVYRPFHYRCFRYLKIEIQTAQEDCLLYLPEVRETHFPFPDRARFYTGDKELEGIFETAWRTLENSCHDSYIDCPYYERLQYFGDINISYPLSLYVGGRDQLLKSALEQAFYSMEEEELSACAFPASEHKIIPFFSLCLINLLYRYSFHTGDKAFAKLHLANVRQILDWFDGKRNDSGTLGMLPYWNFVDCPPEWPWNLEKGTVGEPPGTSIGDSSILNFQYLYGLKCGISLFDFLGESTRALEGRHAVLKNKCLEAYWDEEAAYFRDTSDKGRFSQHGGIYALLADAVPGRHKQTVLKKILSDKNLIQASVHVLGYLHALVPGIDQTIPYKDLLAPWRHLIGMGFTTFPEYPGLQSRSDCHPWSAFPAWEILHQICGFAWIAPAQECLQINPRPIGVPDFRASFPSRFGSVELAYRQTQTEANRTEDRFDLKVPAGLKINWIYGGETRVLTQGRYHLSYKG